MTRKIKIGFIGCGGWARKKYLPFLSLNDKIIDVSAISEIQGTLEKTQLEQKLPHAKFYQDANQMLSAETLDGVVVSLPHSRYFDVIGSVLDKKIPVLADKPASISFDEMLRLVHKASSSGTYFSVNSQRRAFPGIRRAHDLIQSHTLGVLHWLRYDFLVSSYPDWQKTWRNDPSLSGDINKKQGILLDTGFHCIDSILFSLNYSLPAHVYAKANYYLSNVETDVMALLEFGDGHTASILVSRNMPKGYEREVMAVLGNNGYYSSQIEEKNGTKNARTFLALSDQEPIIEEFDTNKAVIEPLELFIEYLSNHSTNELYLAKNVLPTMKVIDALYESILSGQKINIDPQHANVNK